MKTKICTKCNVKKPVDEFYKCKTGKYNVRGDCKPCRDSTDRRTYSDRSIIAQKWRSLNKNKISEYNKRRLERISKEKREKECDDMREWRKQNKEKFKKSQHKWKQKNRDKINASHHKRRARKLASEGQYTAKEWIALKEKYNDACLCCGCRDVDLTIDHIIPLARGGTNDIENIQPLCMPCNSHKSVKTIDYRP